MILRAETPICAKKKKFKSLQRLAVWLLHERRVIIRVRIGDIVMILLILRIRLSSLPVENE